MFSEVELAFFLTQLHYLINGGIKLYPAVEMIYLDISSTNLKKPLKTILKALREGESFSDIIHNRLNFPLYISNIIRIGENTDNLSDALEKACKFLDNNIALKRKVFSALLYPLVLIFFLIGLLLFTRFIIWPQVIETYIANDSDLPMFTQFVLFIGNTIATYWWFLPFSIAVFFGGFTLSFRKSTKFYFARLAFSFPIFGTFNYYLTLINFLSNLGSLHNSGNSIIKSFQLTIDATDNVFFKEKLKNVLMKLIEGEKLSSALFKTDLFPNIIIKMIMVGEETAQLDTVLFKLTEYLSFELEIELKRFVTLIFPVSIVIIGFFVLIYAITIILPIVSLSTRMPT